MTLSVSLVRIDESAKHQGAHIPLARSRLGKTARNWIENYKWNRNQLLQIVGFDWYLQYKKKTDKANFAIFIFKAGRPLTKK
jgi:hypothetical protein